MRILYYDCFCGISGDMNLGALIDLGVDKNYLKSELAKLNIDEEFELKIEKKLKKGINGTKVDVILKKKEHKCCGKHHHHHEDGHNSHKHEHDHSHCKGDHTHHHHEEEKHNHSHHHNHGHHHEHRNLPSIEKIINSSDLKPEVKELAIKMFMEVAKAEAKVHGKSIDEVHFHEVGATDSIVDLVGAAICLNYLDVDKIMASSVQLGGGFVNCAHGKIPVPAPATVEILHNMPVKTGLVQFETTTPTGAAILSANVEKYTDNINFKIEKTAYGLGTRELEVPNVLRVYLGTLDENREESVEREKQYILETNIDDMNPELYQYIEEKLLANGARDVYKTPIIMKKGRAAVKLTILYSIENEENIMDIIFKETTSIGFRKYEVEKVVLKREIIKISTKYGEINVKKSTYKNSIKYKAEYENCKKAANEFGVTIREIYRETEKTINLL